MKPASSERPKNGTPIARTPSSEKSSTPRIYKRRRRALGALSSCSLRTIAQARAVAFRRPSSYAAEPRMLHIFEAQDPDYSARLRALCARSSETPVEIEAAARTIIADVRKRGDAAVR